MASPTQKWKRPPSSAASCFRAGSHGLLDLCLECGVAEPAKHHAGGQHGRHGVGNALPSNVGCRAVNRLEQAESARMELPDAAESNASLSCARGR